MLFFFIFYYLYSGNSRQNDHWSSIVILLGVLHDAHCCCVNCIYLFMCQPLLTPIPFDSLKRFYPFVSYKIVTPIFFKYFSPPKNLLIFEKMIFFSCNNDILYAMICCYKSYNDSAKFNLLECFFFEFFLYVFLCHLTSSREIVVRRYL